MNVRTCESVVNTTLKNTNNTTKLTSIVVNGHHQLQCKLLILVASIDKCIQEYGCIPNAATIQSLRFKATPKNLSLKITKAML